MQEPEPEPEQTQAQILSAHEEVELFFEPFIDPEYMTPRGQWTKINLKDTAGQKTKDQRFLQAAYITAAEQIDTLTAKNQEKDVERPKKKIRLSAKLNNGKEISVLQAWV